MLGGLSPENERVLSGSLLVFYQITKKQSMKLLKDRVEYDQILEVAAHRMLSIANSCLAQPTPEALLVLKLVVKIYCSAVMYAMPAFMLDTEMFAAWMAVFVKVLSMQVETPSDGVRKAHADFTTFTSMYRPCMCRRMFQDQACGY